MRTGGEGMEMIGRSMKTPTGCLYHIDQFQQFCMPSYYFYGREVTYFPDKTTPPKH